LRAQSFGIDPQRIEFLPMTLDDEQDRGRYVALDVALDAFPYTGGDSAACALAEGVPFVTLCGRRHAERVATSVLTHLGVTDTVAHSEDEYVEIAVQLAQDRDWREQVAARIRAALPDHDAAMTAYTRSLEAALREAWRQHASAIATTASPDEATTHPHSRDWRHIHGRRRGDRQGGRGTRSPAAMPTSIHR
jgi:predicted O-linked N-acetylglucosamine transferase (SPINDLY family)